MNDESLYVDLSWIEALPIMFKILEQSDDHEDQAKIVKRTLLSAAKVLDSLSESTNFYPPNIQILLEDPAGI